MPSFSPTMETGKIQKWHVKVGDSVQMGDALAEIETDKSAVTFEATDEFVIAKIVKEAGDESYKIGEIIAYSVDDESELKDFAVEESGDAKDKKSGNEKNDKKDVKSQEKEPKSNTDKTQTAKEDNNKSQNNAEKSNNENKSAGKSQSKPNKKPKVDAKSLPVHNILKMPALSPTMKAGKITEWQVKEGQQVNAGDILAVVETDKATVEFEMQEEGYVAKILVEANDNSIDVGTDVIIIVDNEADIEKFADYTSAASGEQETESDNKQTEEAPEQKEKQSQTKPKQQERKEPVNKKVSQGDNNKVFISPKAKVTAQQKGIDYATSNINGSGPNGRIIDQDIQSFKKTDKAPAQEKAETKPQKELKQQQKKEQKPVAPDSFEEIPLSNMRKVIAQRLTESKQNVPHYYLTSKVEMNALLAFKKKLQEQTGLKLSVSDFLIKAVSFACQEVPEANSQWAGDKINRFHDVDVSFAVDTGDGLITPIVKKANLKTISAINKESKDLINKAKEKKLKPDEFMGGTFTISNLGMMGIDCFSAVINPPQSCILAVGKTSKEPVYDETNANGFRFADVMYVTLSCDHRVVDGAVGAKWLQVFKKYIENPILITL